MDQGGIYKPGVKPLNMHALLTFLKKEIWVFMKDNGSRKKREMNNTTAVMCAGSIQLNWCRSGDSTVLMEDVLW